MEATIPTEIGVPTFRTKILEKANTEAIAKDLDMIDELRGICGCTYSVVSTKNGKSIYRHIKQRAFRARDLVLRRVFENTADPAAEKFQPNWEGPYMIVRVGVAGLYALNKQDGPPMPRMWNSMHLKVYYQ